MKMLQHCNYGNDEDDKDNEEEPSDVIHDY